MNLNVDIKDWLAKDVMSMADNMGEDIEHYISRALRTQLRIDAVVMERAVYPTEEEHLYPIMKGEGPSIVKTLMDKNIPAELVINKDGSRYIKTNVSPKDFSYVAECRKNHEMSIRLPVYEEKYPEIKTKELMKMYNATSFSYPTRDLPDPEQ